VKAVDELEAQRDQQRKAKQKIGPVAADGDSLHVAFDMKCNVDQAAYQNHQERRDARAAGFLVERAFKTRFFGG
jgi:hypothetical protein